MMLFNKELLEELGARAGAKSKIGKEERARSFEGFGPVAFSKDSFFTLSQKDTKAYKAALAVDGGNQPLLEGESFALDFIRVSFCLFSDGKIKEAKSYSGFVLAYLDKFAYGKDELAIKALVFDSKGLSGISDGSYGFTYEADSSQVFSKMRESINAVRRSIELNLCLQEAGKAKNSFILADGPLYDSQSLPLIKKLSAISASNSLMVFGISKTSSLFTESGRHLPSLLMSDSPESEWGIQIAESTFSPKANVFFARLHRKSKLCFRIDTLEDDPSSLSSLLPLSTHSAFLGYPYPLIVADKTARVKNQEKQFLSTYLKRAINDKQFDVVENLLNAHSFLDTIG
jgi:hypothetical protein